MHIPNDQLRKRFNPWRDTHGVPIPQQCRIEQLAVDKRHGALPSRLHKQGQVLSRGVTRLNVLFDDENELVSIRPHLVRVLDAPGGSSCQESLDGAFPGGFAKGRR